MGATDSWMIRDFFGYPQTREEENEEQKAEVDTFGLSGTSAVVDGDGDGVTGSDDCNDNDASQFPGAAETCDGVDNNCDGQIDEGVLQTWFADADRDGFGDPSASAEGSLEGVLDARGPHGAQADT